MPLLHLGLSLGCTNSTVGFVGSENRKVHTLRRPLESTTTYNEKRSCPHCRGEQFLPCEYRGTGLCQSLPGRLPEIWRAARIAAGSAQADCKCSRKIYRPGLRRERGGWHKRFIPCVGSI